MSSLNPRVAWTMWGLLFIVIAGILVAFLRSPAFAPPPPVLGQVNGFTLTNQSGVVVNAGNLRGRVWIADIIFTRCPLQCVRLTRQLAAIQADLPPDGAVQLVSLTADPEWDTPAMLSTYAARYGATNRNWQFLTGTKAEIRRLSVDDLKFVVAEKSAADRDTPDDLFIHSTRFVVVDRGGRIRGYFDGESPGVRAGVQKIVTQLLREPSP